MQEDDAELKVSHPRNGGILSEMDMETSRSRSTETSKGLATIQAQLNNLGREIKKVNEKVYVAQVGCETLLGTLLHQRFALKEEDRKPRRSLLKQFGGTFSREGILLSTLLRDSINRNNLNPSFPKKTSFDSSDIRNQGASIKTLEIQIRQMSKNRTLMYETKTNVDSVSSLLKLVTTMKKRRDHMDHNSRHDAMKLNNPYSKRRKTMKLYFYLALLILVCCDNALVVLRTRTVNFQKNS
ncbi:hypothetical protein Tco_1406446 [Tanacetum coccineum]